MNHTEAKSTFEHQNIYLELDHYISIYHAIIGRPSIINLRKEDISLHNIDICTWYHGDWKSTMVFFLL